MSTRTLTAQPSLPTEATLREAALRHLARYAATEARLARVLERGVARWLRAAREAAPEDETLDGKAAAARQIVRRTVAGLVATGVVDDAGFAASRAQFLSRSGKSRRAILQHLASRGIDPAILRQTVPEDPDHDLGAALLLVRRRRLGTADARADPAGRARAMGILARAGFSHAVARAALDTPADEADARIARMRQGCGP